MDSDTSLQNSSLTSTTVPTDDNVLRDNYFINNPVSRSRRNKTHYNASPAVSDAATRKGSFTSSDKNYRRLISAADKIAYNDEVDGTIASRPSARQIDNSVFNNVDFYCNDENVENLCTENVSRSDLCGTSEVTGANNIMLCISEGIRASDASPTSEVTRSSEGTCTSDVTCISEEKCTKGISCIKSNNDAMSATACESSFVPSTRNIRRPIFNIEILGFNGTALIDTGAKQSIAGHTLYNLLVRQGHPLQPARRVIKLADGNAREVDVLLTTLEVQLDRKAIKTPFLILPEACNNETLLGIDFLLAAKVVIDFSQECWYFIDGKRIQHKLRLEPDSLRTSCAYTNIIREDKGMQLQPPDRRSLAQLLPEHADIFRPGGAPTPFNEHSIDTGEHIPIAVPPHRMISSKSPAELRREQLADPEVEKITKDLEGFDEVSSRRWTERGYLMDQGVLYRFNPDSDRKAPQLVLPISLRSEILNECHNSPLAGHPGIHRTYLKISQLYYFPGMRRVISDFVKACTVCQRYKPTNEKPPGLLQTPVLNQRNEVLAIDLFGPLPEGEQGERWVLLVEDTATRWVELYALREATAEACAHTLIEEYFLRYGLPRRVLSDNGAQFVGAVMQQCMFILGIKQSLVPLYHPAANPAERKNRDLKMQLSYLVENDHFSWPKKLAVVRYAMNSAVCRTTGTTPAFLMFGRNMRSPSETQHDLRAILDKENFVPQITPYLRSFISSLSAVRERVEEQQDKSKAVADQSRRQGHNYEVGDKVLLKSHVLSNASKGLTAKFTPKRDGPYLVKKKVSPTTYIIAPIGGNPEDSLGKYHTQDLTPFVESGNDDEALPSPIIPKRHRGRPKQHAIQNLAQERGRPPVLEGESIAMPSKFKRPARRVKKLPSRYKDFCNY